MLPLIHASHERCHAAMLLFAAMPLFRFRQLLFSRFSITLRFFATLFHIIFAFRFRFLSPLLLIFYHTMSSPRLRHCLLHLSFRAMLSRYYLRRY